MKKHLPNKDYFIGKNIPGLNNIEVQKYIDSGEYGHIFKAYNPELKKYFACKIIPFKNLNVEPNSDSTTDEWMLEAQHANMLDSPVVVRCQSKSLWIDKDNGIECLVLCFDYINGLSLRKYIQENKGEISVGFIKGLLHSLFGLLYELDGRGMQHGDLHSGNILIEEENEYQLRPQIVYRVTDFGVGELTSTSSFQDDYERLTLILKQLLENVNFQNLPAKDRYIFNELNNSFLGIFLTEHDKTREPIARDPKRMDTYLDELNHKFAMAERDIEQSPLLTPFDYLSCEQIGESHSILKSLYSDQFLGLSDIESKNNIVLTGPRGCGKSTVFKSLGLSHKNLVDDDKPETINYIGIYYRCEDLYYAFSRYKHAKIEGAIDIPMHYLTSTLIINMLDIISSWALKYYKEYFSEKKERLSQSIWKELSLTPPKEANAYTFDAITTRLETERQRTVKTQRQVNNPDQRFGAYFGPNILPTICNMLCKELSFLSNKPFYFFIDDYSAPKITIDLQESLNRLVMQRAACCFFKLSTESPVSFVPRDIDGKTYVEGREINLVNLGLIYLGANTENKLKFIEDVIKRRLSEVSNYPVSSIGEIVGDSEQVSHNDVARKIREHKKHTVYGKQVLAELCSGDIFYIIKLVGRMVTETGGVENLRSTEDTPKIALKLQNKMIRDEAGNFLSNLSALPGYGAKLVEVVTAFGNVAHSYLIHNNSRNEKISTPHQSSRIEPYDELDLTDQANKIYSELLRYSVFIEDRRGKSRRGKVVPRLWLRRFLIPHFNLTFSKRDSVSIENRDFEMLLSQPQDFLKKNKQPKGRKGAKENDAQSSWSFEEEGE